MSKIIVEKATEIEVVEECDVLVVGGGPAGSAAAIAAARNGSKTVLLERYGHLGGMSTGGQVILIPALSFEDKVIIKGIMSELMLKLEDMDFGVCGPRREIAGKTDEELIDEWKLYFDMTAHGKVSYGGYVHPDLLKIAINELVEEAGVNVYLHSWGCKSIMDGKRIEGVYFESKEGRKAVIAKTVIDCTGDGDIFTSAGAGFDQDKSSLKNEDAELNEVLHGVSRTASLAVVYRLGGVDFKKFSKFKFENPQEYKKHADAMNDIAGYQMMFLPTNRNDVVWCDNWVLGYDCLKAKDLTEVEFLVRRTLMNVIEYINSQDIPGLNNVWLYDVAPQIGTRGSRRVHGEYCLTMDDLDGKMKFDDVVAVFPPAVDRSLTKCAELPLRTLIAKDIDNLFVAGRCFSSEVKANSLTNLVPHCYAMGQAAGVAASVSSRTNGLAKEVDIIEVQSILKKQDVYLPR